MGIFSLPYELLREIYADVWAPKLKPHLFLGDGGRLQGSPCLGANLEDEPYEFRYPSEEEEKEKRWRPGCEQLLERLQSPWGPHYRCEELLNDVVSYENHPYNRKNNCVSMLLVCRKMNIQCLEIIRELLVIQITDLDTALFLADLDNGTAGLAPVTPGLSAPIARSPMFGHIRCISLCLFMARKDYLSLSAPETSCGDPHEPTEGGDGEVVDGARPEEPEPKAQAWRQLWPALAALPHLADLSIWLDHDYFQWSEVDERALLRPVALAGWDGRVRVTVRMPALPKDKVWPGRHFHEDGRGEGLPFGIVRRMRRPDIAPLDMRSIFYAPDVEESAKDHEEWGIFHDLDSVYYNYGAF